MSDKRDRRRARLARRSSEASSYYAEMGVIAGNAMRRFGGTQLDEALAAKIAASGNNLFQNYKTVAADLEICGGRHPHPESVGRSMRKLARWGVATNQRIYPGQIPPGGDHPNSHGTTLKKLNWEMLGVGGKNVLAIVKRQARVRESIVSSLEQRPRESRPRPCDVRTRPCDGDAQSSFLPPPPPPPAPPPIDTELAAVIAEAREANEAYVRSRVGKTKHVSPVLGALARTSGPDPPD